MKKRAHIFKGLKAPLAAAAVVFAATLVLSAPLSIVSSFVDFERQGIAYSSAEGTIWNGVFTDLTARGAPLGDVSFRLSSLSVLAAAPAISFQARGGAVIGEGCLIAGGAVILGRTEVPAGSLVAGVPAKVRRALSEEERAGLISNADVYLGHSQTQSAATSV